MSRKKVNSQNSKNLVRLSIDKERKQYIDEVSGFINFVLKYREDLISSKFSATSEEKLKILEDFLPGVREFIQTKTKTFKNNMNGFMLRNIETALWYYLHSGLIIAQHGKSEIADSCLSYIDQLRQLEKLYPKFHERSKIRELDLYRIFYSEIKSKLMPVEFIQAFLGLKLSGNVWNQENKNYYCDLMEKVLKRYEIPIKDNLLIWSRIQVIDIFSMPNFLRKSGVRTIEWNALVHMKPDLLEPDKWRWEYFAALMYAANLDFDQTRKYAQSVIDNISLDPSEEKSIYKPLLLRVLGKTDLAESEALQILDRDPGMMLMYQLLGAIYVDKKAYERASDIYKKALRINFHIDIAAKLYSTLIISEDDKEATKLKEQIKTKPIHFKELDSLFDGMLYFISNDFKNARKSLEHSLEFGLSFSFNGFIPIKKNSDKYEHVFCDSNHIAAKLLLAEISILEEKYSEALKLEYEVLALRPKHHLALDRISQVFAKLHGLEEISTEFKRRADLASHVARQISGWSSYAQTEVANSFRLYYEIKHEKSFYSQDIELLTTLERIIESLNENSTQLLLGDTGVGKDLVARIIHERVFKDSEKPFVSVNCGGITESLFESEMFGSEPGSYTGADRKGRDGYFITANGGTIFLNEIAEIPLTKQATLLGVLQTKKVRKVGSDKEINVKFLLISATNKNLKALVKANKFREDLYHRICGALPLNIPPLKERREDISLLFMVLVEKKYGPNMISIESDALEVLKEHPMSGNVREIEALVERIAPLGYVKIDAEVMMQLITMIDSQDLHKKSKLSIETRKRMRLWFSLEFKNKTDLLKMLKETSDKPKDKKSLNKQLSSVFLEIGEQVKWKDLASVITLCLTERILPEEKVTIFEKLFLNHLKKIAMVDSTNDQLISQWVYPNDMKIFGVFRNSNPKWVK